ncbi:hypothetical protein SK128_013132 [Halocaridina rubra]|uniref:RING-type domain-containing protein n=1 Tax=Halocaridina rubra TaxID=373956 RepID=A0AAN8XF68_HALRR
MDTHDRIIRVHADESDVMEDAVTCSICSEEYKSGKHDPLIFPCGHTFCRQCIEGVKKTKNIACPTCREPCDESKINELAMNYSILSLSENLTHFKWPTLSVLLSEKTPHAFMDLAIGQQYLGRVYIEVWGHLKRSQHFLVLCLGLQGPCYKGGTFRSSHKDDFKERICGCYYKGLDGTFSTKGIMENLEWDGEYAGKSYEGLVVGTSGGRSDMDALFSIYTKVKSRATCFCPFGEVVSGLDVVKQALMHDPVSDVSIKGCGIVIPSSLLK